MNLDELAFSEAEYDAFMLAAAASGGLTADDGDVIQSDAEKAYVAYLSYRMVLAGQLSLYVRNGKVHFLTPEGARERAQADEKPSAARRQRRFVAQRDVARRRPRR